jgi:hypothetical protein
MLRGTWQRNRYRLWASASLTRAEYSNKEEISTRPGVAGWKGGGGGGVHAPPPAGKEGSWPYQRCYRVDAAKRGGRAKEGRSGGPPFSWCWFLLFNYSRSQLRATSYTIYVIYRPILAVHGLSAVPFGLQQVAAL